jgi:sortase A
VIVPTTDKASLKRGVGHIAGTAPLNSNGNCGLAGHRDSFFRALRLVAIGDTIAVTTPETTWRYRVHNTRIVPPSAVEVLAPSAEPQLTLVTCYPFSVLGRAPKRYIVEAEALDPAGATNAASAALPAARLAAEEARDGAL